MPVVVITPAEPLLDLSMVKQHLRLDDDDTSSDLILAAYVAAAQASIDGPSGWLGRCIGQQKLELRLNGFLASNTSPLSDYLPLPYPPLIAIEAVTYQDTSGADAVLAPAAYTLNESGLFAAFGTTFPAGRWAPDALRIRYTAGYEVVPPAITVAMLLMVGDLYANRETTLDGRAAGAAAVPMSVTVESLLCPFRVFG